MTLGTMPEIDEIEAVVAAIGEHGRFLVTSHESPDGDAVGSLLAMHLALCQLGKDSVMVLVPDVPLPGEYGFLGLEEHGLLRALPSDHAERVLVAVDCAQESRLGPDARIRDGAPLILDIDHHHDNTRFGHVNLIVPDASSTGEILADLFAALGVVLTPRIANALYTALVTDTGRFQYTNTTPKALRLGADLVEAGADAFTVFRNVYEAVPFAKLKLLARALERAELHDGGRVIVSVLLREDFGSAGAVEPYSEGIIDYLRAVEGVELAALIREPPQGSTPARKVSLRSSTEDVDVSVIARQSGGGGHRQAAGFSSDLSVGEIRDFVVAGFAAAMNGNARSLV